MRYPTCAVLILALTALLACDQQPTEPEPGPVTAFGRPGPPPGGGPPEGRGPACDTGKGFAIDGEITAKEQVASIVMPFTEQTAGGGTVSGAFYLCNSPTDLYVAMEVDHGLGLLDQEFFLLYLDISRCDPSPVNCLVQESDAIATRWWNGTVQHFDEWFYTEPWGGGGLDTDFGGTEDLVSALVTSSDRTVIEMSKPLHSGDDYDFALVPGTVEELFQILLQFNFQGDESHYTANTFRFAYEVQ